MLMNQVLVLLFLCMVLNTLNGLKVGLNSAAKIAVIGSGSWGTAVARRVALNVANQKTFENKSVKMWVYDEIIKDRLLSDVINNDHMNSKYLPNVALPGGLIACPNIIETCKDADLLFFIVPHQFLPGVIESLKGNVKKSAVGVSFIKGIQFSNEGPVLLTDMIKRGLDLSSVAAVMGANVASDVASDSFVETTVSSIDINVAKMVASVLQSKEFQTEISTDQSTVEFCGALKNVVAIGAGDMSSLSSQHHILKFIQVSATDCSCRSAPRLL